MKEIPVIQKLSKDGNFTQFERMKVQRLTKEFEKVHFLFSQSKLYLPNQVQSIQINEFDPDFCSLMEDQTWLWLNLTFGTTAHNRFQRSL